MEACVLRGTGLKNCLGELLKKAAEHAQRHSQETAPPRRCSIR